MDYGERIKRLRESKGVKACFVAEQLGLTPAGYSGIENGRRKLSAENAQRIATILQVDIRDIFFGPNLSETLNYRAS